MKYSIYRSETGRIVSHLSCGPDQVERNIPPGCGVIEGHFDPTMWRIQLEPGNSDGDAVIATAVEVTPELPTIEVLRAGRWEEIKRRRDMAEFGGFTVEGIGTFDSDQESKALITGSVVMAQIALSKGLPFSVTWTLADNTHADIDAEMMVAVGAALGAHVEACFSAGRVARDEIESASTREEVMSVEFQL